jgi:hypothetical protein
MVASPRNHIQFSMWIPRRWLRLQLSFLPLVVRTA